MPVLNFTLESKIAWIVDPCRDGEGQTIRPARKYPIKPRDRLYLYAQQRTKNCRKLGEAICSEIMRIEIFTPRELKGLCLFIRNGGLYSRAWFFDKACKLAINDGFDGLIDFQAFFINTYKLKPGDSKEMEIIKWKDFVSEVK